MKGKKVKVFFYSTGAKIAQLIAQGVKFEFEIGNGIQVSFNLKKLLYVAISVYRFSFIYENLNVQNYDHKKNLPFVGQVSNLIGC